MGKNKTKRSMEQVKASQQHAETLNKDKFSETQDFAQGNKSQTEPSINAANKRISPQISCTVLPEDKELLNELTLYCSNKAGKVLNISTIIRSLIRLGHKYKDQLET